MKSRTTPTKSPAPDDSPDSNEGKKAVNKRTCITLPPSTLAVAQQAASADGRSLSNYITQLIQRDATLARS